MPTDPQPPHLTQGGNPLWAIPLSALSNTRDRPLFSSSRRPPPSVVAPIIVPKAVVIAKAKDPERPQLALVGTIAHDDERFGIFLNQSTATALRLKVGEDFQGWILREVEGREAKLEKDRQTVVLSLPQPGAMPAMGEPPMMTGLQPKPGQPSPEPRRRGQPGRQM
jgi:general secretion pathway protein N